MSSPALYWEVQVKKYRTWACDSVHSSFAAANARYGYAVAETRHRGCDVRLQATLAERTYHGIPLK